MHRRQIYRHLDWLGPIHGVGAGPFKNPLADPVDESNFFCNRYELTRRDQPLFRMTPARQRLHAAQLMRHEVDDWLVMDLQLVLRDGVAEIRLDFLARIRD